MNPEQVLAEINMITKRTTDPKLASLVFYNQEIEEVSQKAKLQRKMIINKLEREFKFKCQLTNDFCAIIIAKKN